MKNGKTFYEAQTVVALRKFFSLPPTHSPPDKILLRFWNKNFLTEIYRNKQAFVFKVFQECSSWASRNGALQMFSLALNRNMFAGKFVKVFGCVYIWVYISTSLHVKCRQKKQTNRITWSLDTNIPGSTWEYKITFIYKRIYLKKATRQISYSIRDLTNLFF